MFLPWNSCVLLWKSISQRALRSAVTFRLRDAFHRMLMTVASGAGQLAQCYENKCL